MREFDWFLIRHLYMFVRLCGLNRLWYTSLTLERIAPKHSEHFTPNMSENRQTINNGNLRKAPWSHQALAAFIQLMDGFLDDLQDPLRRKLVFKKASSVLMSMGFTGHTPSQCHQKWKSLIRTYRANKNGANKGKCRFYFHDNMEKLLNRRPEIVPQLTIESNDNSSFVVEVVEEEEEEEDHCHNEEIQNETPIKEEDSIGEDDTETEKHMDAGITYRNDKPVEHDKSNNTRRRYNSITTSKRSLFWSYEATLAFIDIMENFLDDFGRRTKRKLLFHEVNKQLISMGFRGFTPAQCFGKWRNLLRTYKAVKENKNRGRQSLRFYYFDKMDKLLAKRSVKSAKQSRIKREESPTNTDSLVPEATTCTVSKCLHEDLREEIRQKRHDERMAMEKDKLRYEKRSVDLFEKILENVS